MRTRIFISAYACTQVQHTCKAYVRTGFACIIGILKLLRFKAQFAHADGMTKEELVADASAYSDTPFLPRANGNNAPDSYSGWSAMSTLQDKALVTRGGRPQRFRLTSAGLDLAERLVAVLEPQQQGDAAAPADYTPLPPPAHAHSPAPAMHNGGGAPLLLRKPTPPAVRPLSSSGAYPLLVVDDEGALFHFQFRRFLFYFILFQSVV